ncbi:MAG: hypothetical protein RSB25_18570, partial [Acinetobacter sp.]
GLTTPTSKTILVPIAKWGGEVMRSEFEEYYSKKYPNDQCTLIRNGNYSGWLKQQLWESWQHQQTKVDELQKRVDSTLQLVNEMKGKRYPFSAYADQLEQALKGGDQ